MANAAKLFSVKNTILQVDYTVSWAYVCVLKCKTRIEMFNLLKGTILRNIPGDKLPVKKVL
jgi:hypothetical protein